MVKRTPDRFVRELAGEIQEKSDQTGGLQYTKTMMLSSIVADCGWKARSAQRMERLRDSLESAGVYAYPNVDDPSLKSNKEWILFSNRPSSPVALADSFFDSERKLHKFVKDYYLELFDNTDLKGLRFLDSEAQMDQGVKTLSADMLFEDHDGSTVVVEFKAGAPKVDAVAQLHNYMTILGDSRSHVKGVLITARPPTREAEKPIWSAIELFDKGSQIEWYWYSIPLPLDKAIRRTTTEPG